MTTISTSEEQGMDLAQANAKQQAAQWVGKMTVEEQALLLSGDGWWATHGIERLGLPPIALSDGPHGLRKVRRNDSAGAEGSVPSTCFPTASALAATWNVELIGEVGRALGREAQAVDVQVLLGPGINIKRSPLGGRNFEYFSEDPVLAGRLAAAYIEGVQSEGVGTSLKHFAVNSQEDERMATSSDLDLRTLHEIYLSAFEIAVTEAKPWTVMSSYNLVNGTYASENAYLLTDILRRDWGYDGLVVSDWGGINDRVAGVEAGNDLEMPGSGDYNRKKIIAAVNEGRLSKAALARAATEVAALILRAVAARKPNATFDAEAHHALARRTGAEAIVLLKNEQSVLPLAPGKKIALIGGFATTPRYQGAGSSMVNPTQTTHAAGELAKLVDPALLTYAAGYDTEGETTQTLVEEAVRAAQAADVAVIFAGLPDSYESEGFDRQAIDMPPGHVALIEAVAATQPNVVVVLLNGSAVAMPWAPRVKGILEAWLGGQAGGGAIADVLTGQANPSGKLAETFPQTLEQTPAFPNFPGRAGHAVYGEGVFVGYRYYDAKRVDPLFPFGFGLSYTKFAYGAIRVGGSQFDADRDGTLTVEVDVKNVGPRAGKEIVQLYVHERSPAVVRPINELRAFEKVSLESGEQKTVRFVLSRRDFAYFDAHHEVWAVESGAFDIRVGGSSRDLPLSAGVEVRAKQSRLKPLTRRSLVGEFKHVPGGEAFYVELVRALGFGALLDAGDDSTLTPDQLMAARKARMSTFAFIDEMPAIKVCAFSHGKLTEARLDEMLDLARSGASA
ncbi:MAG TPA: glycoside hydrolase family 3 C-terminal domain-containing protein [Pararobbsia sp.]|nr:glycoside hydrolase family 3 C-terminal domain-containing protein [Pararobbsia sp.]